MSVENFEGAQPGVIGERHNKLVLMEEFRKKPSEKSDSKRIYWKCKCDCGRERTYQRYSVLTGRVTSCGKCEPSAQLGPKSVMWKGYGGLSGDIYYYWRKSAERRGIPFELSIEFIWDLFLKQNKRCALSGVPLELFVGKNSRSKKTVSIDRIDSSKGYTENNVQITHKLLNVMKQSLSNEEFVEWCRRVVAYQDEKERMLGQAA